MNETQINLLKWFFERKHHVTHSTETVSVKENYVAEQFFNASVADNEHNLSHRNSKIHGHGVQSDDSLISQGLRISQIEDYDNETDELVENARRMKISLPDRSFLSGPREFPESRNNGRHFSSSQKQDAKIIFSASHECSKSNRFTLRRAIVIVSFLFALGMINPSFLSRLDKVSVEHQATEERVPVKQRGQHQRNSSERAARLQRHEARFASSF